MGHHDMARLLKSAYADGGRPSCSVPISARIRFRCAAVVGSCALPSAARSACDSTCRSAATALLMNACSGTLRLPNQARTSPPLLSSFWIASVRSEEHTVCTPVTNAHLVCRLLFEQHTHTQ